MRIFHVTQTGNLSLDSVTVRGGNVSGNGLGVAGGGLLNDRGRLTLTDSAVRNNSSLIAGGAATSGRMTMRAALSATTRRRPGPAARRTGATPKQTVPEVNLIRSVVFKNYPTNCAPPNSVARCDAVGSAPATN